jgi:hypothetical protein
VWGVIERRELPVRSRLGLVSSRRDWLISTFLGLGPEEFEARLEELIATEYDDRPGRMAQIVDGNQHVFFDSPGLPGVKGFVEAWRGMR